MSRVGKSSSFRLGALVLRVGKSSNFRLGALVLREAAEYPNSFVDLLEGQERIETELKGLRDAVAAGVIVLVHCTYKR